MAIEFCNNARTTCIVEDGRPTFDVQVGGRSGTPTLEIPVISGNLVEVTCQFIAKNPDGGFDYDIQATSSDARKLTQRPANVVEGNAGWQSCTRTDYFLATVPTATADDDVTLEVIFGAGGLSNPGQAGSFMLTAKIVGSMDVP